MRTPAGYQGTFYALPDRGYNVAGTSDYRARLNNLSITFKPLDDPRDRADARSPKERHRDAG
jgi:hypothetical protein